MNHVVFYDKVTREIMGTGSYSNPDDIPNQHPHVEVEEELLADSNSILEVYEEAGEKKVRIIGRTEDPPTVEEILADLVKEVKEIKEQLNKKSEKT